MCERSERILSRTCEGALMGLINPVRFGTPFRSPKIVSFYPAGISYKRGLDPMAIYSLNHSPISKKKHPPGRAGAHLRYISRAGASPVILTNEIPSDWKQAQNWMNQQEEMDRANARIADRIMIALPIELTSKQRQELIQDYLRELTDNQIPWFVAIHQEGKDAHNPHAHVLIRDRSLINGRRVVETSERGSTQRLREKWSEKANKALLGANYSQAIDHRSLKAQGIDREPTRHRGWQKEEKSEPENWVQKLGLENGAKNWAKRPL